MMKKLLIAFLMFILSKTAVAQETRSPRIQLAYDTTAVTELYNQLPVGLIIHYDNGKSRSTKGFLHGRLKWNDFDISLPEGNFNDGIITFDRQKIGEDHQLHLQITDKKDHSQTQARIGIPYVTKIRFNLYTDSIKPHIDYYLNVEGLFSSGRVYPLDTSVVSFTISAGKLNGQNIIISDPAINIIKAKAVYKPDHRLQDTASIYRKKFIDTTQVKSEQEVLKDYKQ